MLTHAGYEALELPGTSGRRNQRHDNGVDSKLKNSQHVTMCCELSYLHVVNCIALHVANFVQLLEQGQKPRWEYAHYL